MIMLIFRLLVVFFISLPAFAIQPEKLIFAFENKENYPAFVGEGADIPSNPGTYVEILREVSSRMGFELELVRFPWARALFMFESGKVDAINGSYKAEREKFAAYPRIALDNEGIDRSKHITRDAYVLYVRRGMDVKDQYLDVDTIVRESSLAVPQGYSIVSELKQLNNDVFETNAGLQSLARMLTAKRVDAIVAHERPMDFFLIENPGLSEQIIKLEPPLSEKNYYIMLSKEFEEEYPEFSYKFWSVIADVRKEMYQGLEQKYKKLKQLELID